MNTLVSMRLFAGCRKNKLGYVGTVSARLGKTYIWGYSVGINRLSKEDARLDAKRFIADEYETNQVKAR